MKDKKGLIMGVANNRSIAWGIAKIIAEHGGKLAFTYQGEALKKRVEPLANTLGSKLVIPCDVSNAESIKDTFKTISKEWGSLDFIVHAIGFSDRDELRGKYINTSLANFNNTMRISCYSFTEVCRLAEPYLNNEGLSLIHI